MNEEMNEISPITNKITVAITRNVTCVVFFSSPNEIFNSASPKKAQPSEPNKKTVPKVISPIVSELTDCGNRLPTMVTIKMIVAVQSVV